MKFSFVSKYLQHVVGTSKNQIALPSTIRRLENSLSLKTHFRPGATLGNKELIELHNNILQVGRYKNIDHPLCHEGQGIEELRERYSNAVISLIYDGTKPEAFLYSPWLHSNVGYICHVGLIVSTGKTSRRSFGLLGFSLPDIILRNGILSYYMTSITRNPGLIKFFSNGTSRPWPEALDSKHPPPEEYFPVVQTLLEHDAKKNVLKASPNLKNYTVSSQCNETGFKGQLRPLTQRDCENEEEDLVQVGIMTPFYAVAATMQLELICGLSRW
eukprot:CAMPEP_0194207866 /NCGR_PEP_ID=MMETSP0156-20130528/6491_1 /TAXON_ID=33649 /ORGANISM="Thalassionema nitzschioides, Strain L26-B" /LENGTH=271 /DNA_ID=CAMNT_0038934729 /DNA_START=110 /DNA_END=922 /DNA_ORIENTATION=+